MQKLRIDRPIIVEGKYDKIKLASLLDADIITTEGFGIFSSAEKLALIRKLAAPRGVIVMTDSDGAGTQIRAHISSALPKEKVTHLYIPRIMGKERRKKTPSKAGTLGVEGMEIEMLREIFMPFSTEGADKMASKGEAVTKAHFFADGLTGVAGAVEKRDKLAAQFGLPPAMTPNALLTALNILTSYDGYREAVAQIDEAGGAE